MAEPAPPAIRARAVALLISPQVAGIDFLLGHVTVSPRRFARVAEALESGRIGLVFDPDRLARAGGDAAYDPVRNQMILQGADVLDDPFRAGFLVHEAVHAGTDMAARRTSLPLEEAGAFIAQIWYMQNVGFTELRRPNRSTIVFWRIAAALRTRAEMEPLPIEATGEQVSDAWTAAVRAGYPQIQFNADGI